MHCCPGPQDDVLFERESKDQSVVIPEVEIGGIPEVTRSAPYVYIIVCPHWHLLVTLPRYSKRVTNLHRVQLGVLAAARENAGSECCIFTGDEVGGRFGKTLAERARMGIRMHLHLNTTASLIRLCAHLKNSVPQRVQNHDGSFIAAGTRTPT